MITKTDHSWGRKITYHILEASDLVNHCGAEFKVEQSVASFTMTSFADPSFHICIMEHAVFYTQALPFPIGFGIQAYRLRHVPKLSTSLLKVYNDLPADTFKKYIPQTLEQLKTIIQEYKLKTEFPDNAEYEKREQFLMNMFGSVKVLA